MNEKEFMYWLKGYTIRYIPLCNHLGFPEPILLLTAYNVGRLYFETSVFNGLNMDWDFVFVCNLWIASKILMDEDYDLTDVCAYMSSGFTPQIFVNMEYFIIKTFGFNFRLQFY